MRQIRATVSGSFARHLADIQQAVQELRHLGVRVLSPEQPTIVDALDGFVFVASDRHRSVRLVQDRHLASIANSDFLWLECGDGYVGQSAAMELGFAIAIGVPVYSCGNPQDLTMRQYVYQVESIAQAVSAVSSRASAEEMEPLSVLVDPSSAIANAQAKLDRMGSLLATTKDVASSRELHGAVSKLGQQVAHIIALPGAND